MAETFSAAEIHGNSRGPILRPGKRIHVIFQNYGTKYFYGRNRSKVGPGGRVVIPSRFRKELGLETGDEIVLTLEGREVRLLPLNEAVRRSQLKVRSYAKGRALSSELIQERRVEAERQDFAALVQE